MRFHVPTKIIFSSGALSQIKEIVERDMKASEILLVTDRGMMDSGIAGKVLSQLENVHLFDRVEQNPRSTTVNEGGEIAREIKPDLIVGMGGGSSLDAAKAIALLATNSGGIEEYEGREKYRSPPLPILAIPTTCGTGSEVTWVSVISYVEKKSKISIKGPLMFPAAALIDPDVLITLPQSLIASTGMDALTHAIEAYTVKPHTPITDIFAREALQLIFSSLPLAYEDIKKNIEAREKIMLGSTLAGMAFGNSDVASVHCIAETVGGLYDIPHGIANSIFLPFVMEYNLPAVKDRYAAIARLVGIKGDEEEAAYALLEKIRTLSCTLRIPSFKDLGIREVDFSEIARRSVRNNSNPSNPREMGVEDYMTILQNTLHES